MVQKQVINLIKKAKMSFFIVEKMEKYLKCRHSLTHYAQGPDLYDVRRFQLFDQPRLSNTLHLYSCKYLFELVITIIIYYFLD